METKLPVDTPATEGAVDRRQLEGTYVLQNDVDDPSYIIGAKPGVRIC